jgi:hypothetical protein
MSEIRISRNYFPKGNMWTESTSPWTASGAVPRWTTVTVPGEARRIGRDGVLVHGTSPRLRKNGEETEVSLTGGKRGQRRVGHNRATVGNNWRRRRSVEWELRNRKHVIEVEVSVVMVGGCSSSIHSGRGGTPWRGRGKRPAAMALTPLMAGRLDEGLRSEIKEGNQGVE